MLILLVVLWLLGVWARDDLKDSKYIITHVPTCPKVGYFLHHETRNTVEPACFLCFCQGDGTAVCWQRENRKCDNAHYQHGVAKSVARVRRSPVGFSDIFFRDAARDLFNKQEPETCKPYETSFSEGCPPTDWCVGCTVCDCDANGRWDCHILSFCPDKKDKSKLKTTKKRLKNAIPKRTTTKPTPKPTTEKKPVRTSASKKTAINTKKKVKIIPKDIARTNIKPPNKKSEKKIYNVKPKNNNSTQKRGNASPKPLIIKKEAKKSEPITIRRAQLEKILTNDTEKITKDVYNKIFVAMQKFLDKRISAIQPNPTVKTVQKRTMVKRNVKNLKNTMNAKKKVEGRFKPVANKKKNTKSGPENNQKPNKNMKKSDKKGTTKKPSKPTNGRRSKREINDYNITDTIVIENSSYTNMGISTILPNSSIAENKITQDVTATNSYYKYSIITPTLPLVTVNPKEIQIVFNLSSNTAEQTNLTYQNETRDKENHFDKIQELELNSTASETNSDSLKVKETATVDKPQPDFNDLKFNNWPQVKLFKNSIAMKKLVNINSTIKNETPLPSVTASKTNYFKSKDVARVISPQFEKYNRSKIVNKINCHTHRSTNRNITTLSDQISRKIENLQTVLKRVLGEFRNNNTAKIKLAPKRFNVIKYMKKFFGKLFRKHKNNDRSTIINQIDLNTRVINSICDNFRDCDKTKKNSLILRYKIRELDKESDSIIRTIKIIKGLLHLLDFPTNPKQIKTNEGHVKSNLNDDIRKLNAVLKDKYIDSNTTLTPTQMTQIRYIKNNIQSFVQSVGKFANILNEIITILTKNHNTEDKHAFKTVKRSYDNKTPKNETNFEQLKETLVQYNFMQNNFIRKMYDLVTKAEKHEHDMKAKVNNENIAKKGPVGRVSRNIIDNLRKLKDLSQMFNTRRQKRQAMRDEGAMEYLLTLMEYLIKQNYPLDATPVNDGIDLLIEAIKSAPDIKPIKKKVMQSMPSIIRVSRTTEPVPSSVLEDSNSDSGKVSEDSSDNDTRSDSDNSSYQEKNNLFKPYQPGKNIFELTDELKTEVYYDKVETLRPLSQIDTTTQPGALGIFADIEETTEHNNFEKFESVIRDTRKKFDIYNSEDDDEVESVTSSTSTTLTTELETDTTATATVPTETTELNLADIKTKEYNLNSIDVPGNSGTEKKIGLDWLDEGYEDSKEVSINLVTNETATRTQAPLISTTEAVSVDNVSFLTKEINDEQEKKRRAKINIEDVMFKKQMDLLNSLDYGTERNEDTESKEGDDRYSGDAFPSYFV